MLSSSHTSALQTKHAGLEARLREEMGRPAPDAGTIQQLKRAKLRIKEELGEISPRKLSPRRSPTGWEGMARGGPFASEVPRAPFLCLARASTQASSVLVPTLRYGAPAGGRLPLRSASRRPCCFWTYTPSSARA